MYRENMDIKMPKFNKKMCGKRGFTLAELCIVMALVVIVSIMIVSFSTLMGKHSTAAENQYDFLEEFALINEHFYKWAAEYDTVGNDFTVSDEKLVIKSSGGDVGYSHGAVGNFQNVKDVRFSSNDSLIKCTVTSPDGQESSFVFSPRCATVKGGGS